MRYRAGTGLRRGISPYKNVKKPTSILGRDTGYNITRSLVSTTSRQSQPFSVFVTPGNESPNSITLVVAPVCYFLSLLALDVSRRRFPPVACFPSLLPAHCLPSVACFPPVTCHRCFPHVACCPLLPTHCLPPLLSARCFPSSLPAPYFPS